MRLLRCFGKRILGDLADADASSAGELLDAEASARERGGGGAVLPWAPKARAKLGSGDVPAQVRIVRLNMLFVSKKGLLAAAIDRIRRVVAFGNPDFYRAQAIRQLVYGRERLLHFDGDAGDWISLPRGCESSVTEPLETCGAQPTFKETRCGGRPIKVEFKGALRSWQALAVEVLAACDIGILVAPPAFDKTVAAADLIARRRVSTLILVEKVTLLEQWKERLEQFLEIDEELPELLTPTGRKSRKKCSIIGQIGGGKRLPGGVIDIALGPALFEKGDLPGEKRVLDLVGSYGMVICDECHHVSAFSFEKVMREVKARYVHGLTGTPKRSDGLQVIAFMQRAPVRYQAGKGADSEGAPLLRVMVSRFAKTRLDDVNQENFTRLVDGLCADGGRNGLIVRDVACVLDGGGTALVLTLRVEHATTLEKVIAAQGYETMLLVGSDPQRIKREKPRMFGQLATGKLFAIVATGSYVGEGFDDDRLNALFLVGPVSWRARGAVRGTPPSTARGYELRPATDVGDVRGEFVTPESYLERFEVDVAKAAKDLLIASSEVRKRCVSRSRHAWRRRCRVEWSCRRPCPIPRMQSRGGHRRLPMPLRCSSKPEFKFRSAKPAPISWSPTVPQSGTAAWPPSLTPVLTNGCCASLAGKWQGGWRGWWERGARSFVAPPPLFFCDAELLEDGGQGAIEASFKLSPALSWQTTICVRFAPLRCRGGREGY